jgi:hypothetical protein
LFSPLDRTFAQGVGLRVRREIDPLLNVVESEVGVS